MTDLGQIHTQLPPYVRKGDPIKAEDFNDILRVLRGETTLLDNHTRLHTFATRVMPFRLQYLSETSVRIHPGDLVIHGGAVDITTDETDINLSSKPDKEMPASVSMRLKGYYFFDLVTGLPYYVEVAGPVKFAFSFADLAKGPGAEDLDFSLEGEMRAASVYQLASAPEA